MDLYKARQQLNSGISIYNMPLRVTFYARVSTEKDEQLNSLVNQVTYFEDKLKKNPNWTYVKGYVDEGISGTSVNKREEFLRMIKDGRQNKFDLVITKEISRFARSTLDSIKYTRDLLEFGVGVLFESDNINTLLPDSELRLTIMASIAQDEVRKLSERTKFGFKRAIEAGRVLGNDLIWGYKKDFGKLVIDEKEASVVKLMYELYAYHNIGVNSMVEELSNRGIYNHNGKPFSYSTITRILKNPKYKGYYCGNKSQVIDYRTKQVKEFDSADWIVYEDSVNVPPIVSVEVWEKVNSIMNERSDKFKNKRGYDNRYPYSGKLICKEHGVSLHRAIYKYRKHNQILWQCSIYHTKGRRACNLPNIYEEDLNEVLKSIFFDFLTSKKEISDGLLRRYRDKYSNNSYKDKINKCIQKIEKFKQMQNKIIELNVDGKISDADFDSKYSNYNCHVKNIDIEIEKLLEEEKKSLQVTENIKNLENIIKNKTRLLDSNINELLSVMIDKIYVEKGSEKDLVVLDIHYKTGGNKIATIKKKKNYSFNTSYTYDKGGC